MQYIDLYLEFIKIRLQGMIEYKKAFLTGAAAQAISYATEFFLLWVMIRQFNTIAGWSPYEVMFLYALNLLSYAIAGFFLYMPCVEMLSPMVQSGEFDAVLIKPLNPLLYMSCSTFCYGYFSHVTLSIAIIVICFIKLGIIMTPVKILFLVITALSGALIQGSAFIFTSVPTFWLTKSNSLSSFMWMSRYYIEYPLSIYNKIVQVLLTLVIPYAFVNFYPAQYFLNKNDFLMFHPVFQYLSPAVGIIMFFGAYKFWNFGIKHYKSTGS